MMREGTLSMEEADRAVVMGQVAEKRLRQREAAELGVSVRQVKRLLARYRERGAGGLVSGHRGKASNNALGAGVGREAMELVRERYPDFGPTFACEKLVEVHGHRVSVETVRKWMVAEGVWRAKARRGVRVHQSRARRECEGDLVQIDGSPHDWFEGRGPACTLIVYVDDATTRLVATGFFAEETTEAYMETTRAHLATHGRAVAYYSDRYSVFRVNGKGKEDELTQFSRALRTLDIEAVHAHSPQAKGRVERANQTLQDRLVKEMRLRGVDGMKAGNAYLPEFMADFNRRFAVTPRNPEDAHRAVAHDAAELDLILCEHHARKLTKNLAIRFECREYQVTGRGRGYRLRGASVTVCKGFDGSVRVLHDGREWPCGCSAKARRRWRWKTRRRFGGEWRWPRRSSSRGPPTSRRRTIPGGGRRSRARRGSAPDEGLRRFGLGLRSLRSLRPRPNRRNGRCSIRRRRRRGPVTKGDISTLR